MRLKRTTTAIMSKESAYNEQEKFKFLKRILIVLLCYSVLKGRNLRVTLSCRLCVGTF